MRKFISLMSAAAMVAALVPSVAMAEDTVLYSNSFNGYPTSVASGEGEVFAVSEASQDHINAGSFQWMVNSPQSRAMDKLTAAVTGTGDDTALIMVKEKEEAADKYLSLSQNRFPGRSTTQITGFDGYTANSGESLVISFKAMLTEGDQGAATLDLGALGTITSDTLGAGEWKDVKLVVANGATTKYVDGTQVGDAVSAVPSVIKPVAFTENTKCSTYATVCIDELVILSSADGVDAVIPTAADQTLDEITTHTVDFVVDGETVDTKSVNDGSKVADIPAVPEKEGYIGKWVLDDGTAFTSATVITEDVTVTAEYALAVEPVAKAATIVTEDGELRISEKTAGAVFRFETKDLVPEGQTVKKAELIVKAAPRSYKDTDARFENTEIWTMKVNSNWKGESNEITGDAWNNLSKGDAFDKQYTAKYPSADPNVVPPYQTLNAIDVTDKINEDGVAVFAFKTGSAREHAIDAVLTLTFDNGGDEPSPSTDGIEIHGIGASTIVTEDGELRVSNGTKGAVFRFDTSDVELDEGQYIKKAELAILAAPRSYKAADNRFENTEIWTYKVGSNWSGESIEISEDAWNKLSKGDPIDKQYTAKYPSADPTAVPPYQHLNPIDVTDMIGEDGVAVFAVKAGTEREHAVDAFLVLQIGESNTNDTTVAAAAKASTKIEDGEFRISDKTNGAVYKFDINGEIPADEQIVDITLYVSAAPRSYKEADKRFENAEIWTYKVGSTWSSESTEISPDDWNKLSKGDPIDKQYTAKYPTADPNEKAPYQTLKAIDVTDMFTDGVATFAFKTGTEREHAIDAYVVVTTAKSVWTKFVATKDANGVLTNVTMTAVDDPAAVALGANEYLWNQFQVPYVTAE